MQLEWSQETDTTEHHYFGVNQALMDGGRGCPVPFPGVKVSHNFSHVFSEVSRKLLLLQEERAQEKPDPLSGIPQPLATVEPETFSLNTSGSSGLQGVSLLNRPTDISNFWSRMKLGQKVKYEVPPLVKKLVSMVSCRDRENQCSSME